MSLLAQITDPAATDVSINQGATLFRVTDLGLLITRVLNVGASIAGLLILGYLIWGGLDWILAQGDKSKIEAARAKITQGVIGLVAFLSVFAIYAIISYFLGLGNHLNIGGLGGTAPGTNPGNTATCNAGTVGQSFSDGGAGGYCSGGGSASVKCVGAGVGPSGLTYPHFEPCGCLSGTLLPGYSTAGCQ